jgi:hypothetical protein
LLETDSDDYVALSQQLEALEEQANAPAILEEGEDDQVATENETPNVTEQNVQLQESEIVNPGEDASLE